MSEKVFLILVDGMRIDAPDACGNDYVVQFKTKAKLLAERTVMPSVTLPWLHFRAICRFFIRSRRSGTVY